ncbi:MAG: HEAT repeat domain-containing protein, partial [Verrucomicrobiae bacterium]|nr:HEAT repeat domain-containing protein [Verrucomicrobiae bacterium]
MLPGLRRIALEAARGQSIVGSWGHRFAGPDGRLVGYGMMNSPGVPLTIGMVMARKAGIDDPEVATAIERSAKLLRFYIGKGAVPYGDHAPWMETHEDNGKCGMAAVFFNLRENEEGAAFFSRMSTASHGSERDCGHTGNFFNLTWAMPGIAISGPNATGAWMKEFGAAYFDLARRWDGTFRHQGPPEIANDKYAGWDASGAYLLAYAMPLKRLWLTGKKAPVAPQLAPDAAARLVRDGRGWSNNDRNSAYDALDGETLVGALSSWSPIVRERAAMALARRKEDVIPILVGLLDSPSLETRLGACAALARQKERAAPALPALRETFHADDSWLRVKAAEAIAATGGAGMAVLPEILKRIAAGPPPGDPRGMEQRFLCFTVFDQMLRRSLDGVDRDELRDAVVTGLHNEDGRARSSIGRVYEKLSYEEIRPLLPAIHEAIVRPAPSGIMFASGIRLAGVEILAKHRIREGIPLCLDVMEIDKWGKQNRILSGLKS